MRFGCECGRTRAEVVRTGGLTRVRWVWICDACCVRMTSDIAWPDDSDNKFVVVEEVLVVVMGRACVCDDSRNERGAGEFDGE